MLGYGSRWIIDGKEKKNSEIRINFIGFKPYVKIL